MDIKKWAWKHYGIILYHIIKKSNTSNKNGSLMTTCKPIKISRKKEG